MVVRVLQLSDTHLFSNPADCMKGVNTYKSLKEVVELAGDEIYDFVALTGDLSQDETADSYQHVAELVSVLGSIIYYIPGNHDDKVRMQSVFEGFENLSKVRTFTAGSWRFIFLDSAVAGRVEGELSLSELQELSELLGREKERHIAIFLHHNPVNLEPQRVDPVMLQNADQFWQELARSKNVRAVICGHVHQDFTRRKDNLVFISTPSTCVQFKPTATGVTIDEKPPGYRYIEFLDTGEVNTRVERLSDLPQGLEKVDGDL